MPKAILGLLSELDASEKVDIALDYVPDQYMDEVQRRYERLEELEKMK